MSYCRCSTLEEVNREFVRTIKDRIQELNLNRKTVAAMACCDVSNVAHVLGCKREVSLAFCRQARLVHVRCLCAEGSRMRS